MNHEIIQDDYIRNIPDRMSQLIVKVHRRMVQEFYFLELLMHDDY